MSAGLEQMAATAEQFLSEQVAWQRVDPWVGKFRRWTIWQCQDFCCEQRSHSDKWWNVGPHPGNYHSVPTWQAALAVVRSGRLPWDGHR